MGVLALLPEVADGGLEELHVVVPRDVPVEVRSDALAVAHLAEHAAIGAGDALHGPEGAVGVPVVIQGGLARLVHILGGDLTALGQIPEEGFRGQEAALAMGDGDRVVSPIRVPESQGERSEATRVRTIRDWWRPMVL